VLYAYASVSDRRTLPRRDREPDGAPESLVGRIDPKEMGSRVQREAPKDLDKKKKKAAALEDAEKSQKRRVNENSNFGYTDIIEATEDVEGLTYRPRTAETRQVYELILSSVHRALGDQAQDIIRSAADTILETLKSDALKDFDKKKDIESVIGTLTSDVFAQLVSLSKKITDYGVQDDAAVDPDTERKDAELDGDIGVAVLFEDEEVEEEEEGFEIRDDTDDDEGEQPPDDAAPPSGDIADDSDAVLFGNEPRGRRPRTQADTDRVLPHEIDGFWLQRLVSVSYPDPVTATAKTAAALNILASEANLRDCENGLMDLFDYDKFDLVRILTKNRDVIVWCTKLSRSDENDRMNVEVAMREKGVGWILKELSGDRSKPAAGSEDSMDVDMKTNYIPSTGQLVGGTVAPRTIMDLDTMAFSQGGHLMSNKKVTLPDGSFKRSKKGYEEIHVPAPRSKPVQSNELVLIEDLPFWVRTAFEGNKTLNRVQSKLYPVAFGSDEPILLCAPTGAGKVSIR
jgi:pre-mRNA-splicing helicase BRR2